MDPQPPPPHGRNRASAVGVSAQTGTQMPWATRSSLDAHAALMKQELYEELAYLVKVHKEPGRATLLLLLASARGGRARSFLAPKDATNQKRAEAADVAKRNATAIVTAIQRVARKDMYMKRIAYNALAEALGLTPPGGPPFFGLVEATRPVGGNSSASKWGPCWPPDLHRAVAAMADRLDAFVAAYSPRPTARNGRRSRGRLAARH